MADMSREEAAQYLAWMQKLYPGAEIVIEQEEIEAIKVAVSALRGWVKTADRLPTEADAGVEECVATIWDDGERHCSTDYYGYVARHPEQFPYWMPLPPLPDERG